jgi:CRISPR system Cascade subunit CasA
MTTPDIYFNLVDEPWIPVIDIAGIQREVSLRAVFDEAETLASITGELPTQSVAILRILLAVLHRAVDGPRNVPHWARVSSDWSGTLADIGGYLDYWHDYFWLQHPRQPFMQVPDLQTAKNEVSGLAKIISDGTGSDNKPALFSTRQGSAIEHIPWSEAARWLIHAHAYDIAGIHSGAEGDPRVKGGKGYSIGTGWAGQIGAVYLSGHNLRETLLNNLLAGNAAGMEYSIDDDIPVWERAMDTPLTSMPEEWTPGGGPEQRYRPPTGPVDLYTWPSRRLRLFGTTEHATGVINAQGDKITPQNRHHNEPMSAWRYSEPQTKKLGTDTYMPLAHDPSRAMWRGLGALLPIASKPVRPGGPPSRLHPGLARWTAQLVAESHLADLPMTWHAVGVAYGSNESVFDEVIADHLELPTFVFSDVDAASEAEAAVDSADKAVFHLGSLAVNIAHASGASTEADGARTRATTDAFARLDHPFRQWVLTLGYVDPLVARATWQHTVFGLVNGLAEALIDAAGPPALVGRTAGGRHVDAGIAMRWFRKQLRDSLPRAHESLGHTSPGPQPAAEQAADPTAATEEDA